MTDEKITVKTPGKLMVAGEFAVLEPHQHLITMAVDRFVYVTLEKSGNNRLNLTDYNLMNIDWHYNGHNVITKIDDERLSFVKEAIKVTYTYLQENDIKPNNCILSIKSELADESGIKYGLGSSAAVVTAVVTALLADNLNDKLNQELIFKLASLSHINVQGNGSGADIAASTYGGMVVYTSFQAHWLIKESKHSDSISSLVNKEWPYLSIKQLNFPENFHLKIGWTGSPASTRSLVNDVMKLKSNNREQYDRFLMESEQAVQNIVASIETHNFTKFLKGIKSNRTALARLGQQAGVDIETEKLRILSELAENYEGTGKLSGAGGGDCGIAFLPSEILANKLTEDWEQYNIKPLNLTIHREGSKVLD